MKGYPFAINNIDKFISNKSQMRLGVLPKGMASNTEPIQKGTCHND